MSFSSKFPQLQYYKIRSTFDQIITKIKRVNFFRHSVYKQMLYMRLWLIFSILGGYVSELARLNGIFLWRYSRRNVYGVTRRHIRPFDLFLRSLHSMLIRLLVSSTLQSLQVWRCHCFAFWVKKKISLNLYSNYLCYLTSTVVRYDKFSQKSHSFICHQTRALPAFTPQSQSITALWLVLIAPALAGWPGRVYLGSLLAWGKFPALIHSCFQLYKSH